MMAKRSTAQRLGRVLERVTQQSGRLPETPAYGSWLLGRVSESPARRRVRIQLILTVFIVATNLIGIGVALLCPRLFGPKLHKVTYSVWLNPMVTRQSSRSPVKGERDWRDWEELRVR